jgi:diguanylate cyclase (GGDEF)-like protein
MKKFFNNSKIKLDYNFEYKRVHVNTYMGAVTSLGLLIVLPLIMMYLVVELGAEVLKYPNSFYFYLIIAMYFFFVMSYIVFKNVNSLKLSVYSVYEFIFSLFLLCSVSTLGFMPILINNQIMIFMAVIIIAGALPLLSFSTMLWLFGLTNLFYLANLILFKTELITILENMTLVFSFCIISLIISKMRYSNFYREYLNTKIIEEKNKELSKLNEELALSCEIDPLTGIYNRRKFDRYAKSVWEECKGTQQFLSALMLDIDFFKGYNDYYGHIVGDDCLVRIARQIVVSLEGEKNCLFRFGGEEFVVLLKIVTNAQAFVLAEKIRTAIEDLKIENKYSGDHNLVTVSIGVSTVIPDDDSEFINFIDEADKALYVAKRRGRNRTVSHRDVEESAVEQSLF